MNTQEGTACGAQSDEVIELCSLLTQSFRTQDVAHTKTGIKQRPATRWNLGNAGAEDRRDVLQRATLLFVCSTTPV